MVFCGYSEEESCVRSNREQTPPALIVVMRIRLMARGSLSKEKGLSDRDIYCCCFTIHIRESLQTWRSRRYPLGLSK